MADSILRALAHGIEKAASALRISFDSVPYWFYFFVNIHKLDFLFRILLKLVLLLWKRVRIY